MIIQSQESCVHRASHIIDPSNFANVRSVVWYISRTLTIPTTISLVANALIRSGMPAHRSARPINIVDG